MAVTPISVGTFWGSEIGRYPATNLGDYEFILHLDRAGILANPCNPREIRVSFAAPAVLTLFERQSPPRDHPAGQWHYFVTIIWQEQIPIADEQDHAGHPSLVQHQADGIAIGQRCTAQVKAPSWRVGFEVHQTVGDGLTWHFGVAQEPDHPRLDVRCAVLRKQASFDQYLGQPRAATRLPLLCLADRLLGRLIGDPHHVLAAQARLVGEYPCA